MKKNEQEDDAMDRDGNDLDGGFHPQKHAKSPELAREFLLDAAAIIFKEQVLAKHIKVLLKAIFDVVILVHEERE
jgi:hypothetical protein